MKTLKIYTGQEAENISAQILAYEPDKNGRYPEPYVAGYYKDGDKWVAFDNTDGCCWVEEFDTEEEARLYVTGVDDELIPEICIIVEGGLVQAVYTTKRSLIYRLVDLDSGTWADYEEDAALCENFDEEIKDLTSAHSKAEEDYLAICGKKPTNRTDESSEDERVRP